MATRKYSYRRKKPRRSRKRRTRRSRKRRTRRSRKKSRRSRKKSRRSRKRKKRSGGKCPRPCWSGYRRVAGMGCGKGSCKKI